MFAGVNEDDYVLDAGCGVGGSSIYLAQNYSCQTMGITLSTKQVEVSKENALRHDVSDKCAFEVGSYLSTTFPDNTFDVVWAIESVCYAPDKRDFIREAYRVLKPGGRIIVADFFAESILENNQSTSSLNKLAKSWAIDSFEDRNTFWNTLQEEGFTQPKQKDVSPHVKKTVVKLYRRFFLGFPITLTLQAVGYRNRTQFSNVMSAYHQYHSFKKGLWKYMFYSATKPQN
ncbi:MAG: methyltransferase domain-containing protein [Campylobacterales bacterium]|nr:methyltransferase domain-containing protein [Campylobacterales bacterium]